MPGAKKIILLFVWIFWIAFKLGLTKIIHETQAKKKGPEGPSLYANKQENPVILRTYLNTRITNRLP
jgi:hypothetical protein